MAEQNINKNKLVLKIILPIVLAAVIAGIWLVKVNKEGSTTLQPQSSSSDSNMSQDTTKSDFILAVSEIDLNQLKSYGLPIIIDFGSVGCAPCDMMAPILKKLNQEWQGKVIVKFVDISKYPNAYADFPLQVIPTQFIFDADGKPYVPNDPEAMQMQMYALKDTGEHVFTAHQGALAEEQFRAIFEEMGVE